MRFTLTLLLGLALVSSFPMRAQQAPQPAPQDPQAVTVVNQALNVAGGIPAIAAITDYTATGNITYHLAQDVRGSVTVRGNWFDKFRLDAQLPTGVRSEAITSGQVTLKSEDGTVWQPESQAPIGPSRTLLPHLLLGPVLQSRAYGLLYKGILVVDGHSVHDTQVQLFPPGMNDPQGSLAEFLSVDVFIDPSTFLVVMMQDVAPKHLVRQIRFSDYRLTGGVLAPFSISERVDGQSTWEIQLDQITFNTGLQDSDFQL